MSLAACSEAWGVCENAGNSRSKTRGRAMLPTSREVEVNVSVRHMYLYSREVRGVVARLRAECGSLSVHAVALAHTQGDLNKALGHVRNEKQANVQASSMRSRRPTREVQLESTAMSLAACSEAWGVCENAGNSRSKTRGRAMLPTSREVEVNVSVRHMYLYSREVRGVVARLRAECGSLSVHAVALAHTQGDLNKALGHVRNEKQANVQASSMRSRRPTREVVSLE
ncbi:uncharacterized protein LOC144741148 [Lampetra planeri]